VPRSKKSAPPDPSESFEDETDAVVSDEVDYDEEISPDDLDALEFDGELDEVDIEEDVEVLTGEEEVEDEGEEEPEEVEEEAEYEEEEREPTLDEILKERSGLTDLEESEEEELEDQDEEDEDNDSLTRRVLLGGKGEIGQDEFVCKSCFLVKHRSQLADTRRQLCRDCV
jgi:hypothetical protein